MASGLFIKFIRSFLLLVLFAALPGTAVQASEAVPASGVREHIVKFYFHSDLLPDLEYARDVLPEYVADMNAILAKNTNRVLVFDPASGIVTSASNPHTDSAKPPLPVNDFEIWVHAMPTTRALSHGGYAGIDASGAGVLAGLMWTRIHDPRQLDANGVSDYTIQLNNMLHELAHVFGAGIGEYYSLASVSDPTATPPLLGIKLSDPADAYWSDKPDFMSDPLLRITRAGSRAGYLQAVRFSDLTAAVIDGEFRNGLPVQDRFTVQVLDHAGAPLEGVNIKVWNAAASGELLFDETTDEYGQAQVAWGGTGNPRNGNNLLRLVKAYKDGSPLAQPKYVSVFDMDITTLVAGGASHVVTIRAAAPAPEQKHPNQTETFLSAANQDGWLLVSSKSRTVNRNARVLNLGDTAANQQYRSFLSFDTASIPDNAGIIRVLLHVKRQGVSGAGDPVNVFRGFMADIRKGSFNAPALAANDYQKRSNRTVGPFEPVAQDGWYIIDLSDGRAQINKTGLTQIRLRFALDSNNNNKANILKLFSGNAGMANRPKLVVKYRTP
jgi:hypothetical protein